MSYRFRKIPNYSSSPSSSSTNPATTVVREDTTAITTIKTINKINPKNVNKNPSGVIPYPNLSFEIFSYANNINIV